MKIPKQIKVGAHIYTVDESYTFTERFDRAGDCDGEKKHIRLMPHDGFSKVAKSSHQLSFLHEMIHAVDQVYNGNDLKEETVERLSQGLYQVLKDNGFLK